MGSGGQGERSRSAGSNFAAGHEKAEYLRRDSCVSGKECDGTLLRGFRESGIKQGGTAGNSLSLYQGQVFCLSGVFNEQRHFN